MHRYTPTKNPSIVGIGASAGGLEALKAFFRAMPVDSGMVFIVITHHAPDSTNLLPEILGRCTEMKLVEAEDGDSVKPNCVYLAPSSHYLAIQKGRLVFKQPIVEKIPLPIDFFFRSLARENKEQAMCVILSGTCSDGTVGLQAVKGESGMTMVQDPKTSQFSDMPENAIATGQVDYVLAPQEMPEQLIRYDRNYTANEERDPEPLLQNKALNDILDLIRQHTGSNFKPYKTSTLGRRIERRMHIHQIDKPQLYVAYLQKNTHEIGLLFKEILIGVTAFFRDPEAFAELESTLPDLLGNKSNGDTVRVWSAGCSTGEEAYSLAILLHEYMERENKQFNLQIFATDLDESAINLARRGLYPEGVALDISGKRLEKHFQREGAHYRIKRNIREAITFAAQNLVQDPPFTKLDLLSCRNLLIYLDAETQKKVIPLFHYALRPRGILFLGSSETIGPFNDLFETLHGRSKIFLSKETPRPRIRFARIMGTSGRERRNHNTGDVMSSSQEKDADITALVKKMLLTEHIPPSLVVNEKGDIFFVHGRTGPYLELMPGQPNPRQNALDMAREGLKLSLSAVIRKAAAQTAEIVKRGVRVHADGHTCNVTLRAQKISGPEALRGLIWVTFTRESDDNIESTTEDQETAEMEKDQLEHELQLIEKNLQRSIEEREVANEQLESSNEELQSTNEELQSANEELETAKEEMQSLNEELQTVNAELERKIDDLASANDDMKNLLDNTGIATIFLDKDLNVKRFTAPSKKIIHLIPSDTGRPINDITTHLEYNDLVKDATAVLDTLNLKELEVRATDWHWYLMRIQPYRTAENVIDGVVITFVDITRLKKSEILLVTNTRALEMMALEQAPFDVILNEILYKIESQTHGIKCGVSLLNKNGTILKHAAGPNLPAAFIKKADEMRIEPNTTEPPAMAIHKNKPVIMTDLTATSPATPFIKLALKHDIKAVWSQPIYSADNGTVGVFTVYYGHPHTPHPMEKELINQIVPLMGTIISQNPRAETEERQ